MAYGSEHTETIPTVSATEGEEYATMVNAVLTEMRATLNAKVTPAGIDVNADLSMRSGGTRYGLTNTHRVSLYQQPSNLVAATYPAALYADSGGELYYNDAAGNQIALTSGGSPAGSPGNINGAGYDSGGVEIVWDSANGDYHFYSAATTYADLKAANVLLNDGDTNFIRLDAPALAADFTLTFPNALPASDSLLVTSSAGAMSYSRDITLDTLTLTGAASVGGLLTATGGVTAAANAHITISGTGRFKHGELKKVVSPSAARTNVGTPAIGTGVVIANAGADEILIPIEMDVGERITGFTYYGNDVGAGSFFRGELFRRNGNDGVLTQIGDDIDSSSGTTGLIALSESDLTETVATGYTYVFKWTAGTASDIFYALIITYDRP